MTTVQVEILNPKARKLLQDLADLNLISIKSIKELAHDSFLRVIMRLRKSRKSSTTSILINHHRKLIRQPETI